MDKVTSLSKSIFSSVTQEEVDNVIKEAYEWPPGVFRVAFLSIAKILQKRVDLLKEMDSKSNSNK